MWSRPRVVLLVGIGMIAITVLVVSAVIAASAVIDSLYRDGFVCVFRHKGVESYFESANPQHTPRWTPDGSRVVLGTIDKGDNIDPPEGRIYVVDSDGTKLTPVTTREEGVVIEHSPSLSPDGTRIAFSSLRYQRDGQDRFDSSEEAHFEIEISRIDGTNRRRLTKGAGLDIAPSWSPSGDRIAFMRYDDYWCSSHSRLGVYVMDADGSDARMVLELHREEPDNEADSEHRLIGGLAWSPDGHALAFLVRERFRPLGELRKWRVTLYLVEADGSPGVRVPVAEYNFLRDWRGYSPAWSPDGRSIAYLHPDDDGLPELYAIRREGSDLRVVANPDADSLDGTHQANSGRVSWSFDGSQLLFQVAKSGRQTMYAVNADGSNMRVIEHGILEGPLSPDGSRVASIVANVEDIMLLTLALDGSNARVLVQEGEDGLLEAAGPQRLADGPIDVIPCFTESEGCLQILDGRLVTEPCLAGFVVPGPEENPGLVRDCEALVDLMKSTKGVASRRSVNWDASTPITKWERVTIALPGSNSEEPFPGLRVTELDLSQSGLGDAVPSEITGLSALESLNLEFNGLSGPTPQMLGELSSLKILNLSNNELSDLVLPELSDLANLKRLNLSNNNLSGPIPPELGNLSSLEVLDLGLNELHGPIPPELGKIQALRVLNLSYNNLEGSIPAELANLSSLEVLGLRINNLSGAIPPELGKLPNLREVDLIGNEISGCIPAGLDKQLVRYREPDHCEQ